MSQIKYRLKAAYENVEFYASKTWVHNSHEYQKANQDLYVREAKVRDALQDEPTRPRTVRDSIPESRLAQYANYEYNEARELCYASGASNIFFHYPCVWKRSGVQEPWMLPEVEQLYVWFTYAPDFNIVELLRLEELGHLDEQNKLKNEEDTDIDWPDLHEVSPAFYEAFERTPGKSRYTSSPPVSEDDVIKYLPSQLKIQTFEDMILRLQLKSDKVKHLWSDHSRLRTEPHPKEPKVNILKSPLGNYLVVEEFNESSSIHYQKQKPPKRNLATDEHQVKTDDFGQLQNLVDSFRTLESLMCNTTMQVPTLPFSANDFTSYDIPEAIPKPEAAPQRRLYSAVLQGLTTDKKQSSSTEITPPLSSSAKDHSTYSTTSNLKTTTSSCFSMDNASITTLTASRKLSTTMSKDMMPCVEQPTQWMAQPSYWSTTPNNTQIKNYGQVNQEQIKPTNMQLNFASLKSPTQKSEPPNIPYKLTIPSNTTITTSYSDACSASTVNTSTPNAPCPPQQNLTNMPCYSATNNSYLGNTYTNTCFNNNNNNNNIYGSNYFNSNNYHFNTQYPTSFQNSSYPQTSFPNNVYNNNVYNNNTFQTNQMPTMNSRNTFQQFNRQSYPSTQSHMTPPHSMWFVQQNRPSSTIYSVAHFATQPYLFLPPPPPPHPTSTLQSRGQTQRWAPQTHYARPPSTMPSCHAPVTPQHTSTSHTPQHTSTSHTPQQHWQMQNSTAFRVNSNQQISSSSQPFLDSLSGQNVRSKPKSRKSLPSSQVNFLQQKARSRSPEGSILSNDNFDSIEILSGTYSNASMSRSKRSAGSSDMAFTLASLEKPLLVKSAASTSSIDYRRTKTCSDYKEPIRIEPSHIEKRCSAIILGNKNENMSTFSSDSEDSRTLLPITPTISEELERQALEQYQASDENFYQELERQAEEQYDGDHSENWRGPPNKDQFFGGHGIRSIRQKLFTSFLCGYINRNVCGYCLFLLS